MGSPSVSTCRGLVPWEGLLLVVSLLTFWSQPTTAKINVVSLDAIEGRDALLKLENKPPGVTGVVWYKGMGADYNNIIAFYTVTPEFHLSGPDYNGEEMITDDGSLLLKNVTEEDSGMYTVVAHLPDGYSETGFGELFVFVERKWRELVNRAKKMRCNRGVLEDCIP